MDVGISSKYAVLIRTTNVRLHQSKEIMIVDDECGSDALENNEIVINPGALIRIFESKEPLIGDSKNLNIQVLDFVNKLPIYENLYECPQHNLRAVDEMLWPYVISIADPEQRVRMVEDVDHCKWVMNLKVNQFVRVLGEMFDKAGSYFDCKIHYIGPVTEMYPVGYIFGLEMLILTNGSSPQVDRVSWLNYMECRPSSSIYATANWISKIAIGPSSPMTGNTSGDISSLKRDKKAKRTKIPTAQFYDEIKDSSGFFMVNNNNKMEKSKKGSSNILPMEEFKQSVDTRNKVSERRATNTAQTQTQPQSGILKHKHKDQSLTSSAGGPQIVVINNNTIDEESGKVIVFDTGTKDVDLSELLGHEWPSIAGDAGTILNKKLQKPIGFGSSTLSCNTNSSKKASRNKSSNSIRQLAGNLKNSNDGISQNNRNIDNKKMPKFHNNKCKQDKNDEVDSQQSLYANTPSNQIDTDAAHEQRELLPTVLERDFMEEFSLQEVPNTDLGLGSMVEVNVPELNKHLYGVIRWIGVPPGQNNIMIGVELEDDYINKKLVTADVGLKGISLFKCPAGRGIFVTNDQCSIDRRFLGAVGGAVDHDICEPNDNKNQISNGFQDDQQMFGHMDCPIVSGTVAPIRCTSLNSLEALCGKFKGIQGHHNSCYLDVTLFSMFAFTLVFDAILYRPPEKDDISHYTEVQTVLREEIVNPLRKHMFVRADRVMKLRQLLDKLSSVSGLTSEEKDPEEFLNCLLSQIMRSEPFLKLNSGQDAYYYQLFVEKDEHLSFPSVQQLFEQSFYASDIKLKEVPSCLIIQMPRFGKSYKMYPRILPSQVLDITDIIDDSPRQCSVCGKFAEFECRDCFGALQKGIGLENTSFCAECLKTAHMHTKRANHKHRKLSVPQDFRVMADRMTVPRLYMELFAVLCIETSHYVTFVKSGSHPDAPWCFFDSMADRKGEKNGYNIPEMIPVPDLPQWLSEEGSRTVNETSSNDKMLPEHAKRLFCDAYMCMYQCTDVMMYR